jgi:hypothetical protein
MALVATKGACQNATPGGWKWNLLLLGVLLPASFAWPLSIFWVCEGSIPNPPNRLLLRQGLGEGPVEPVSSDQQLIQGVGSYSNF